MIVVILVLISFVSPNVSYASSCLFGLDVINYNYDPTDFETKESAQNTLDSTCDVYAHIQLYNQNAAVLRDVLHYPAKLESIFYGKEAIVTDLIFSLSKQIILEFGGCNKNGRLHQDGSDNARAYFETYLNIAQIYAQVGSEQFQLAETGLYNGVRAKHLTGFFSGLSNDISEVEYSDGACNLNFHETV